MVSFVFKIETGEYFSDKTYSQVRTPASYLEQHSELLSPSEISAL